MQRTIGSYGKVVIGVIVAGAVIASFVSMGKTTRNKDIKIPENTGNISTDLQKLADDGYYPGFEGLHNFTIKKGYVGKDGVKGLSREEALEAIKGYEYVMENGNPVKKEVPVDKIKVYPYDEDAASEQNSELIVPDVSNTGRYTLKYAIEGESGLNVEQSIIVLVDYLPEGVERQNESGGE